MTEFNPQAPHCGRKETPEFQLEPMWWKGRIDLYTFVLWCPNVCSGMYTHARVHVHAHTHTHKAPSTCEALDLSTTNERYLGSVHCPPSVSLQVHGQAWIMVSICNTPCIFQIMPRVLGFLPRGKRSTDPEKVAGMDKVKRHHPRGKLVTAQISFQNRCQPQSNQNVFGWMDISSFTLINVLVSFPVAVFGYSDKKPCKGLILAYSSRGQAGKSSTGTWSRWSHHTTSTIRKQATGNACAQLFSPNSLPKDWPGPQLWWLLPHPWTHWR